jgi:serine/threonine protein kinase
MTRVICASCGAAEISEASDGDDACPKCKAPALLDRRYRLISILGRGANGITYRSERISDGHLFAIKEMPLRTLESTKAMELFDREARVLRQLDHSSIPKYEDDFVFGEGKSSALYLVQELVEGQSLDEEAKNKRYTEPEVFAIVAEVAEILDYLHRKSPPVIHRDVKTKNVMRRAKDQKLVLIDFGSVRDALSMGGGSTVAGTFGYMAPEQLAGKATPASDVYSLGALAVALLSRKEPDALLDENHTLDVRSNISVSENALELIEEMLARDPNARPKRGKDVLERARALARASTPPKPFVAPSKPTPKPIATATATATAKTSNRSRKERIAEERVQRKLAEKQRKEEARAAQAERDRQEAREASAAAAARSRDSSPPSSSPKTPKRKGNGWLDSPIGEDGVMTGRQSLILTAALLIGTVGIGGGVWAYTAHRESSRAVAAAASTIGMPQLYARPISVDVNGDGTDDILIVNAVDNGVRTDDDGRPESYDVEHGRFIDFVQAIDGKDGRILYSIKVGEGFVSVGPPNDKSVRAALIASKTRLGVVRLTRSPTERTEIEIYELATGKSIKTIKIDASTGKVCATAKGLFQLDRATFSTVTTLDLDKATFTTNEGWSCSLATPNVADAPASSDLKERITSITVPSARFSAALPLRTGGPYQGDEVVSAGGIAVLVHDGNKSPKQKEKEEKPTGITITMDNAVDAQSGGGPDNGKIDIVGLDLGTNEVRFKSSLASLGFTTQTIDHIEGTLDGTLVFFKGAAGLAFIDMTGRRKWAMGLPKGTRLSSYTLAKSRVYLHVYGPDSSQAIYSNLSKKLKSRLVSIDLETGAWWRSLPDGPLDPDPPPPPRPSIDLSKFTAVKGCTCTMTDDGSPVPEKLDWAQMSVDERKKAMLEKEIKEAAKRTDGGKEALLRVTKEVIEARMRGQLADGGVVATTKVDLGMWMKSSVESGGRKRFGVYYSFFVNDNADQAFTLPHYNEKRGRLAPPPTLEGEVNLSMACSKGIVVIAHDKIATAWSVPKKEELWTVDLASSIGEAKTTLGGGATLTCAQGKVEKDKVTLPATNVSGKSVTLSLIDGSLPSGEGGGKDAGAK